MKKTYIASLYFLALVIISTPLTVTAAESKSFPMNFQIDDLKWSEVDQLLPRKAIFTVIDVESGKSFTVQRRAGSNHADVQPLTRKDTEILKEIYNGKWSWRRRSILIVGHNQLIAASMHGMPHGAGALQNGFPGHFCIHFSGSKTHRTRKPDLGHQLMILKAAGKLDEYLMNISTNDLMNATMVFIKNGDLNSLKKVGISNGNSIHQELNKMKKIESIQWKIKKENTEATSLVTTIPVEVNLYLKKAGKVKTNLEFTLMRTSPLSSWKVNLDPLITTLE